MARGKRDALYVGPDARRVREVHCSYRLPQQRGIVRLVNDIGATERIVQRDWAAEALRTHTVRRAVQSRSIVGPIKRRVDVRVRIELQRVAEYDPAAAIVEISVGVAGVRGSAVEVSAISVSAPSKTAARKFRRAFIVSFV